MARKLGSINRKYTCSVCGDIRRTFPAISHHIVVAHDGAAVVINRREIRRSCDGPTTP